MEPSDVSDREEGLRRVVGRKRFKLPRKLLEDCNSIKQASVPRKLRSAMKKRSRESLSPSMPDSKKLKCSIRAGESPKKDGARRSKKQGKSRTGFSVPITKDEEEVVETLYSLAGMFLNNNSTCNSSIADEESSRADASAVPGGIKTSTNSAREAPEELKWSVPSYNEEKLSEETMGTDCPDGPIICEHQKLLDCKPFRKEADSRVETDLQTTPSRSWCEKSNRELHASCNFGLAEELILDSYVNLPEKMDIVPPPRKQERKEVAVNGNQLDLNREAEESQSNGPLLWPGLLAGSVSPHDSGPLQLSTCKIPARLDSASCSTKPRPVERLFPIEKDVVQVPKSRVVKISQKNCVKHVFISHLIKTLQMPVSKDELVLQPNTGRQHGETEQRANTAGPKFNVLQNSSSQSFGNLILSDPSRNSYESRNVIPQQNTHSQGTKSSSSENECFSFLSLSTSASRPNQNPNVPYINSIARQQHMSVPLPTSKTYYYPSYSDQLAGLPASHQVQLQLPSYLGNSGRSFLHRGSMVIPKEHHHQQMLWASPLASSQFKPKANLKAVLQFPTLQNGTIVSWDGSFCCNSSPSSTFLR